ncbi:hypothetical protein Pse7367_3164 [Thalassoporum mexicanum PCC 7367]|uniref:hypothetical protein n=1 Tax=Thalassoporum mexicanum TaxID=3457544 RepID=UPI00029F8E92|nr:hypothetical protein [Pseudanabaena sp. PCC 7367]AFY71412.1 hypothetical protein Pse7367_3164 [Pseudanabaena sp. PCC 7367]
MRIIYLAGISAIIAVATVACGDRPPKSSTDFFAATDQPDLVDPSSATTISGSANTSVGNSRNTKTDSETSETSETFDQAFLGDLTETTSKQERKQLLSDRQKMVDQLTSQPKQSESATQSEDSEVFTTTTVVERDPFAPIPGSVKPLAEVLAETRPQLPQLSVNQPPAVPIAPPIAPIVVDPVAEARAVQVTGVVELNDGKYAIVSVPGESSTRYVKEGQMLASQILVKRIELSSPPAVILQQKGIEVRHSVGQFLSQIYQNQVVSQDLG